ncbi:MAG TPA: hypothetical protein VHN11_10685 [Xanthobacteraceae bacterium]|nr:hypothetical protein [Xanthobacteraceae bacterium]
MANIAALTMRMMGVIMDDSGVQSAWHCDRRKGRVVFGMKKRGIRFNLTQFEQPDIEVGANSGRINGRKTIKAHLRTDAQGNTVSLSFEAAPERQLRPLQLVIGGHHDILDELCIGFAQIGVSPQQSRYLGDWFCLLPSRATNKSFRF